MSEVQFIKEHHAKYSKIQKMLRKESNPNDWVFKSSDNTSATYHHADDKELICIFTFDGNEMKMEMTADN